MGEAILERDVEHTFRSMLRGRGYTMDQFQAAPKEIQEVPAGVFVGDPQLFGEPIVSEEELAFYVDVYSRTGFTGGLNWYRALRKDFEEAQGSDYVIDKPALMISAADDWFFMPRLHRRPRGAPAPGREAPYHPGGALAHWLQRGETFEVRVPPLSAVAVERLQRVGADQASRLRLGVERLLRLGVGVWAAT